MWKYDDLKYEDYGTLKQYCLIMCCDLLYLNHLLRQQYDGNIDLPLHVKGLSIPMLTKCFDYDPKETLMESLTDIRESKFPLGEVCFIYEVEQFIGVLEKNKIPNKDYMIKWCTSLVEELYDYIDNHMILYGKQIKDINKE